MKSVLENLKESNYDEFKKEELKEFLCSFNRFQHKYYNRETLDKLGLIGWDINNEDHLGQKLLYHACKIGDL